MEQRGTEHVCGDYNLSRLGVPREVWPFKASGGKHSYTMLNGNAKVQVLLRAQGFYMMTDANSKVLHKLVGWRANGGVYNAWRFAKGQMDWD